MMKNLYRIFTTALVMTLAINATSAQILTSYFMPNAVESMEHNASFAPSRGYFNVPLVGALSFGTNGNLAVGDLFIPSGDGLVTIFDTSVSQADAMSGIKDVNSFGLSNRLGILGFGRYSKNKKAFWSFDINLRTSANMSMPYEMVSFLKEAPDATTIKDMNFYMESYAEVAFGYSRPINDKINVGGRVKALVGLFNMSFNIDQMDVSMNQDQWLADAVGTFDLYADGMTMGSDINDAGVMEYDLGSFEGTPSGPAGYGAAIDLGATYDFTDRIQFSFAVNDIGFISWKSSANTHATVANNFSFAGKNYDANNGNMGDESNDENSDIEFSDIVLEAQDSQSSTKWLQAGIIAGAEYSILNDRLSAGLIYSIDLWKSDAIHTFTLAGSFTPVNWFTIAASYGIGSYGSNALGLAANFATGFCNIYVATDMLFAKKSAQFIPINQSMSNISFGLGFPFGPKGERNL